MKLLVLAVTLFVSAAALAQSKGNWSMGAFGSIVTSSQTDFEEMQKRANQRTGVSTPAFGNALEFGGYLERRLNSSIVALQLRPSYFTQSSKATGGTGAAAGNYNYSVSGFVLTPLLKVYGLESNLLKLYFLGGIGWAYVSGQVQEGSYQISTTGSNFGFQGGIGVEACFGAGTHCFFTEGNMRYMRIERNLATDVQGTPAGGTPTGPTAVKGQELELDGHDAFTSLSGVQAVLGYVFHF